ncbi:MAG: peptidylprolyl isomerase, partial [Acidobacteriota bacterium]
MKRRSPSSSATGAGRFAPRLLAPRLFAPQILAPWALAAALALGGCGDEPGIADAPAETAGRGGSWLDASPETVVAQDRLGPLTWGEVDAYILGLEPSRRWPGSREPTAWLQELVRRAALDRLLLEEARLIGVDQDPELQELERELRRFAYSTAYLAAHSKAAPPSPEDIERLYEAQKERFQAPERRRVFNLFRRFEGREKEAVRREVEALRERALAGENFEQLAREHSESETRHRGGEIGFVSRGHFSEELDELIFGLEPEVPSRAVTTADGAHLFVVSTVLEARNFALEDVRPLLAQELAARRQLQSLRETAAEAVPEFEQARTVPQEEVARLVRSGQGQAVLFELGDYRLTVAELRARVATIAQRLGGARPADLVAQVFGETIYREILYQHALADDSFEAPTAELERAETRQLIDYFTSQKLEIWIDAQQEMVQRHYDRNVLRFAAPPRLDVTRLLVPRGEEPMARITELETALEDLDGGTLGLEQLAERLGGRVDALEAKTPAELAAQNPGARRFATLLKVGEHSPPLQVGESLMMLRVDSRQEPVERPLALVRDAVVASLVQQRGAQAFASMRAELLEEAGFELRADAIADLLG